MISNNEKLTQLYSSFGDKLLQHTDVLYSIQYNKKFKPITVQLCPTNKCDLSCSYCSVSNRIKNSEIPFDTIKQGLNDFVKLGAKSLEISGGGNPLLYPEINKIILYAHKLGLEIGIITNSTKPHKYLSQESIKIIKWIRVSLSAIDYHKNYDLNKIPTKKLALSYIINDKTTYENIHDISLISKKYDVKFVRLAADCTGDDSLFVKQKWNRFINSENNSKLFIKEINDNYHAYQHCYVGMIRPYWVPEGVFICSSHVLEALNYNEKYKLCDVKNILDFYQKANYNVSIGKLPYCIDTEKCFHCYYYNNNKILHTVVSDLPDKNFA
ncbi:radical SAM protein [archaeon]|nr:radical SAM protein [archaeon]NCT58917.1 radical SAM protein [archaeon]